MKVKEKSIVHLMKKQINQETKNIVKNISKHSRTHSSRLSNSWRIKTASIIKLDSNQDQRKSILQSIKKLVHGEYSQKQDSLINE